jgi:uncharacterized protein (UPF0335 family)
MFAKINQLLFAALLLKLRIAIFGLKVWVRETAYHALTRYSYRTGLVAYEFDPEDPKAKAAIQEAVDAAVAGLKDQNKQLIADLRKARAAGKEVDPAEIERLENQVSDLQGQLTEANKQLKSATKDAKTAQDALAAEQAHTQKLVVENGITAALTEAGVTNPTLLKAAAAMIRTGQKIDLVADGENRVAKIGDKPLSDFVKGWAAGDEGKTFVSAPGNSGGGAGGSGGGKGAANPWAKDSFNMTEQGKLLTSNPTLARQMAAEHGVTIP